MAGKIRRNDIIPDMYYATSEYVLNTICLVLLPFFLTNQIKTGFLHYSLGMDVNRNYRSQMQVLLELLNALQEKEMSWRKECQEKEVLGIC